MSAELPLRSLVYVSGPPGAGKSTLMAHLTRACARTAVTGTIPHDMLSLPLQGRLPGGRLFNAAVELGRRRDAFSGTDALAMNIVPKAEEYMARVGTANTLVLAEGDRLANMRFLMFCHHMDWAVTLIHLEGPDDLLDERCARRGSQQSVSWRRGRITKARNLALLAADAGLPVVRLDARNDVACLAADAVDAVPALAVLLPPDAPERNQ